MLLGDAAHAMSPAGGQGASLALEDGMLIGQFLGTEGGSVTEASAKAESVQRLRAERMVKQAAENDRRQVGLPHELEVSGEERWRIGCWPDYLNGRG